MNKNITLEVKNITKKFGDVIALNDISLALEKGEILALLGENGSGKTSLMNVIAGIYFPDNGEIFVNGEKAKINSPKEAYKYKIGMIHQHYKLIDVFTAVENVVLGMSKNEYRELLGNPKAKFNLKEAENRMNEISAAFEFNINPRKKVYNMAVSEKQTLEILKVLFRGVDILILDEPTAVLTPQETKRLFKILRNMKEAGKTIIIITHKLNEVMEISDKVAVLRKGELIGTVETSKTNENELTEMMVGKKIDLNIERSEVKNPQIKLLIKNLTVRNEERVVLSNINLNVRSHEILGIAGIAGSGQKELLETIAGLNKIEDGEICFINDKNEEVDLKKLSPTKIRNLGISLSFVPEDRLGMGLVGDFNLVDNVMLRSYRNNSNKHFLTTDKKNPTNLTKNIVQELEVVTPNIKTEIRKLSGGNVQKVLVGREIASQPKVLMAAYPVRGLDINSSYLIYNLLNEQKNNDAAVIYVGEDLDVILALCDKIAVLCAGKITGIVDARTTTKEEIGLLMTKNTENEENGN